MPAVSTAILRRPHQRPMIDISKAKRHRDDANAGRFRVRGRFGSGWLANWRQ
jgi:hypothetical protein